ncbi:hypothetical protein LAJ19_18155 (plasmid) [Deinococcus taeanensis]|uniref:hypothetical protein n=1 Tax=Deinococcus taeanensis TaxID=2737050 RepID=UPI001CDCA39B|nr:hypothetical protein [Deinococcus taeanensis]UBV45049.1 hypothetical protein LAJ19_18155 [Deinococcus taeanensis]
MTPSPTPQLLLQELQALLLTLHPALPPGSHLCGAVTGQAVLWTPTTSTQTAPHCAPPPPPLRLPPHAPQRRVQDHQAGRQCAALALRLAGHTGPAPDLARSRSGAPTWPPGYSGSLTHAGGLSLAVAGPAPLLLGIDLEPLGSAAFPPERLLRHVLSESAFKALNAARGVPFDPAHFSPLCAASGRALLTAQGWADPLPVTWTCTPSFIVALTVLPSPLLPAS